MHPSLTRRRLLGVTGGSLLGATLLGPRIAGTEHVDPDPVSGWEQPRADSGNVASTTDPGPGASGRVGWTYAIDDHRRVEHVGLALADGTLLVPAHRSLRGIDLEDGTERFRYAYRRWPSVGPRDHDRAQLDTEPRVRDGVAYVVFRTFVCALDLDSRRLRWRYDVNSSTDGFHLFGNTAYVTARVDGDDRLVALDAETGLERWRRTGRVSPLAAVSGLLVGARYDDGRLIGLEPETGTRRWESDATVDAPSLSRGQVAVADDLVVVIESTGGLTALDAASGDRRWTIPAESADRSTYRDSLAVGPTARALYWSRPDDGTLERIDRDGTEAWTMDRSRLEFGVAVGSETVYASAGGGLLALDVETGAERFDVSPDGVRDGPRGGTPLIDGDRVYHLLGETVYEVRPA